MNDKKNKIMKKGYRYSDQIPMFGHKDIIGYGTEDFYVEEIERKLAYKIVIKNHYSKKGDSVAHNKINLGVFIDGDLLGVLQYGYAMNPSSMGSIVEGTKIDEYLELNRMWLSDKIKIDYPESKAIGHSIKYIKGKVKKIKWIQSFADERCGGLGIVYQAASFCYYGEHISTFWTFEGETYHNSLITNNKRAKKKELMDRGFKEKAVKSELRQFRYIKFLNKREKVKCLLKEMPYLKHYNND